MEDMEREAWEKDALECGNSDSVRNENSLAAKPKAKRKTKKTKFKSLKKGALVSKSVTVKTESSVEPVPMDDDLSDDEMITSPVSLSPSPVREKKRKPALYDDEVNRKSIPKKLKESRARNSNGLTEPESKQLSKGRTRGKLCISVMPLKRVFTIKQEKLKRKGNIWSKDWFPSPDQWSPREDIVLCSVVHEYGPNWNLACEILYGMTGCGFYRGRFRHPVHCCERFRELIQRYVLSVSDAMNCNQSVNVSSGKALLRVTEDNIQTLLGIASELPDHEPLLQKHCFALLTAAWKHSHQPGIRNNTLSTQNGFYSPSLQCGSAINNKLCLGRSKSLEFTNLYQCGVLVAAALNGDCNHQTDDALSSLSEWKGLPMVTEQLDITLELQGERDAITPLPSAIDLSILGPSPLPPLKMYPGVRNFKSSWTLVENRLRATSGAGAEYLLDEESQGVSFVDSSYWTPRFHPPGNQKLLACESVKPSKSKSRRATVDNTDLRSSTASQVFLPQVEFPTDSFPKFDELPSGLPEARELELNTNHLLDMDDDISFLCDPLELIPSQFEPNLYSKLEDWSILPEYTDIG